MNFKTKQEAFWAGAFGDEYIQRNRGPALLASNISFFSKALRAIKAPKSIIEFGANIGMNLQAIQILYPNVDLWAIEINQKAISDLSKTIPPEHIYSGSILEFTPSRTWEVVLIKGVLIHMNPDELTNVYGKLTAASGRYVLLAEYYNPSPVTIPYRGHQDRLFKRDFAGDLLARHPEFKIRDYGFVYHGDPDFPQDDITWFLLERS